MDTQEKYNQKIDIYVKDINQHIVSQVENEKKVLDVGCGNGRMGEYLKKNKKSYVVGIDIADSAIDKARQILDEAICLDIEKSDLPFAKKSFDVIICGDILEHLFDPLAMINKLKSYLKDDGCFLISVPNIANLRIRLGLFMGNFNYQEDGILDETHVRFFTQKTLRQMLSKAGLTIATETGSRTYYFPGLGKLNKLIDPIEHFIRKKRLNLFAFQFIIKATKK